MNTRINISNSILLFLLLLLSSCGPINLTSSNSYSSIEANLNQAQANEAEIETFADEEQTDEVKKKTENLRKEAKIFMEEAEHDLKLACGNDSTRCLSLRRIVKPTGGCSAGSCSELFRNLLNFDPYIFTSFTFYRAGENEEVLSKKVTSDSQKTNLPNVFAEKITGLEIGKSYDITIEKKAKSGEVIKHTYKNVSIVSSKSL